MGQLNVNQYFYFLQVYVAGVFQLLGIRVLPCRVALLFALSTAVAYEKVNSKRSVLHTPYGFAQFDLRSCYKCAPTASIAPSGTSKPLFSR